MIDDIAYVAMGSNLGDRAAHLAAARAGIAAIPQSRVLAVSLIEETEPIGPAGQAPYLNQMVALRTELSPSRLLSALQEIERSRGRERAARWGSRTLDLDIVCYERTIVSERDLVVPHREIENREFWRTELAELRAAIGTVATAR